MTSPGRLGPGARRPLIAFTAAWSVVLLLVFVWTRIQGVPAGDYWFVEHAWNTPYPVWLQQLATFFGDVGTPSVAVVTVALAAGVVWINLGLRSALLVVAASFVVLLVAVLKDLHGPTELAVRLRGADAESGFPSGHAAYAAAVFGLFAFLGRRTGRTDVVLVSSFLLVGMAPARILSAAHVPSELVAGYAAGFAWLGLVLLADSRIPAR